MRIISSTNRDLHAAVRDGALRADLLRELGTFSLELPPLRTRIEDIPPLVRPVHRKQSRRLGRRIDSVDPDSMVALMRYPWPGNVRELAALVEHAMVTQQGPVLKIAAELIVGSPAERAALIAAAAVDPGSTTIRTALAGAIDFDDTLSTGLHDVQREHILRVLNATHWVIEGNSGAALRARPQAGHAAPSHEEARHHARPEPADELIQSGLITAFSRVHAAGLLSASPTRHAPGSWRQPRQSRIAPPAPLRPRPSPG